jgi:hypothetical protein
MAGSKTGSFTPPLPRALSNTLLKMGMRDGGSRSPTVSKPLKGLSHELDRAFDYINR